ncbi:hypothetical protein CUMW_202060 [Citrus unshiu]|nr:hypothetical protein CUMW_202060 [Citrus unshiu]
MPAVKRFMKNEDAVLRAIRLNPLSKKGVNPQLNFCVLLIMAEVLSQKPRTVRKRIESSMHVERLGVPLPSSELAQ